MGLPPSPPSSITPSPAPPEGPVNRDRVGASLLLVIGAILLAVSSFQAWWTLSEASGGGTATAYFLPGSSYSTSGPPGNGYFSGSGLYSAGGLTQVGQVYGAVLWIVIVLLVAAIVAAMIGFWGLSGTFRTRVTLYVTLLLTIGATVVGILLPLLLLGFQPAAFSGDVGDELSCPPGTSPCTTFWGSYSAKGTAVSWGAGAGWYLALAAAGVLVCALILLIASLSRPYTADEHQAASARPGPAEPDLERRSPTPDERDSGPTGAV
jgi:hypothetical protein